MAFADAREAVERTFACFDAAGVTHSQLEGVGSAAFPEIQYTVGGAPGLNDAESLAVADECLREESFFVERLYAFSPGFQGTLSAAFEQSREDIEACLEDAGAAVEPGAAYEVALSGAVDALHDGLPVMECLGLFP